MAAPRTARKARSHKAVSPFTGPALLAQIVGDRPVLTPHPTEMMEDAANLATRSPRKARTAKAHGATKAPATPAVRCEHVFAKDDRQCSATTRDASLRCSNHKAAALVAV